MYRYIETLKNPLIVVKIQKFFGVSYDESVPAENTGENACPTEKASMLQKKSTQCIADLEENKDDTCDTKISNGNTTFDSPISKSESDRDVKEYQNYVVKNKFWYYLFLIGTYLGDELGYAIFFPFWFWNIDPAMGAKVILVWTVTMYIGQSLKDIICWPRPPSPPVIRLQKKWSVEHGMPSTHAMVGVSLPFSILYYSARRFKFPIKYGVVFALLWCTLISLSRLYLGMHSLLDVLAGLLLSSFLIIPCLPIMDSLHVQLVQYYWSPIIIILISLILIIIYPTGASWTPTRGDTIMIISACVGIQIGSWLNYKLNLTPGNIASPPFNIQWPDLQALGFITLRTLLGYFCIFLSFLVFDLVIKVTDRLLIKMKVPVRDVNTKRHTPFIDFLYKYLNYSMAAFHIICSFPCLFRYLNIGRTFYKEY